MEVGTHTAGCARAGEVRGEEEDGEAGKGRGGRRPKVESTESSELCGCWIDYVRTVLASFTTRNQHTGRVFLLNL